MGVLIDPPNRQVTGVSLVYWNQEIVRGQTRLVDVFATGGFTLHEEPWQANDPEDGLDRLIATYPRYANGSMIIKPNMITVQGHPYLIWSFGIVWWDSGLLFSMSLSYPKLVPNARHLADTLTLGQIISLARSVY